MTVEQLSGEGIQGYLHRPLNPSGDALLLTHGAGSNANAPLLMGMAEAFTEARVTVFRFDLPFRQARPGGPPVPAIAARDREGVRKAVQVVRGIAPGRVWLGGHSYGGRQSTIAASEDPKLAGALLLLSYPLHPPGNPQQLRTAHFSELRIPSMFVHGSHDPFGSLEEMRAAIGLIPAPVRLVEVPSGSHDLAGKRRAAVTDLSRRVMEEFLKFSDA